jgi:hypothetical protein
MPPRRYQQESKQGLIITLVICFLFIIGLGVATYFGFAGQAEKEAAAKKATEEATTFKNEREWYKYQAWLYCKYMGHDQDIDAGQLGTWHDRMDDLAKGQKDADAVKKVVSTLDDPKKLGWDAAGKKVARSYEDALAKRASDYAELEKRLDQQTKELDKAQKDIVQAREERDQARKDFDKNLEKLKEQAKADLSGDRKTIEELRNEIIRLGGERETKVKEIDEARQKLVKDLHKRDTLIKQLREELTRRTEELLAMRAKTSEAPTAMRTDWKIIRMDARGTMPYVNLGSADQVKPQLTFSIHGVNLEGRPNPASKGTLEIVNVMGEHLSQARITSVKDPNRDPILKGDVLYNPFWNPYLKKHVAVAGLVDLSTGTGARDPERGIQDFIRQLERQGVIVDAWLDPKDYSIKGPGITVQTDYLILGEGPEFYGTVSDRNLDVAKKWEKGLGEMKKQAADSGVPMKGLRKYLEEIGYKVPPNLEEPTGVSPLYKPRPDQLPPPPVEKQPEEKDKPKEKAAPGK